MVIEIRKARKKDFKEMNKINDFEKILNKCSPLDKLDSSKTQGYFRKFLYSKDKWIYLAEEENELLGFILFNIEKRPSYWKVKKVGYVDFVFVKNLARRKGISKLLIKKAQEILKKNKMKYFYLLVQTDNLRAVEVWKKQGFKEFIVEMYKEL